MYSSILILSFCLEAYTKTLLLVWPVQDPNWYKARRENGLEGMVPANFLQKGMVFVNFLQEAQPMTREKVNLHKMKWVFSQAGDRAWSTEKRAMVVLLLQMQI